MNNIFDIKRFGRYLRYDLGNFKAIYGIRMLVVILCPLFLYLVVLAEGLLLHGTWTVASYGARIAVAIVAAGVFSISLPAALYGGLTDKRKGSDWLMIPASTLEKFLSCLIICLIVAPVIALAGYLVCDGIIAWLDPHCGEALIQQKPDDLRSNVVAIDINYPLFLFASYVSVVLPFLLGAIVFKKNKIAYTIFSLMVISFVLSLIFILIGSNVDLHLFDNINPDNLNIWVNVILNIMWTVPAIILIICIYLRMRHLKQ